MAQPWWEERVPPLSGRELFGAPWKGEGPLPLMGVAPQLQPLQGMLLRRSTDIYPKELARDMREFFSSLLGTGEGKLARGSLQKGNSYETRVTPNGTAVLRRRALLPVQNLDARATDSGVAYHAARSLARSPSSSAACNETKGR